MQNESESILTSFMYIQGHFFYVVKHQIKSLSSSSANYASFEYYLKCREEHSGEERVALRTLLATSKSYNDLDMFLTVQKCRSLPLIFVSTG